MLPLSRPCLILATRLEARPLLKGTNFTCLWREGPAVLLRGRKFDLLLTGVGPVAAAYACGRVAALDHRRWVNLGIAGALSQGVAVGDILRVGSARLHGLVLPFGDDGAIALARQGARLVTTPFAVHDPALRRRLAAHADIVDMEGYAIALAARRARRPLRMIKIASDLADGRDRASLRRRAAELMARLWLEAGRAALSAGKSS